MADTTPVASPEGATPLLSASEQARIRKERREAKLRQNAGARLNKITGLGGGIQRDPTPSQSTATHGDPEEVDISQHYYEPASNRPPAQHNNSFPQNNGQIDDNALRQMMLGMDPNSTFPPPPSGANPFAGLPGMGGMPGSEGLGDPGTEDPMMKMLQQMMGGMPGEGADGMPSFPGMPPIPGQAEAVPNPYAYLWRIIHALFALSLGLYIALTTPFAGSKIERERSGLMYRTENGLEDRALSAASVHFFWIFATVELLLQSSRFFVEKGRVQQGGMLRMVVKLLPEPWKGYLALISRYSRIWSTVSGDAMVLIFVLGACAWWRGS